MTSLYFRFVQKGIFSAEDALHSYLQIANASVNVSIRNTNLFFCFLSIYYILCKKETEKPAAYYSYFGAFIYIIQLNFGAFYVIITSQNGAFISGGNMYRKIETNIRNWIEHPGKAYLLTGARQIGKTWIIRHMLEECDYEWFEINFIDRPELIDILNSRISTEDFLLRLSAILPAECTPHKTIIFFDEIQENPELVTRIKFLVDEGSYRYIMSGSLLGVTLKNIRSVPVGYLHSDTMYPMDFEEFMIANGISLSVRNHIKESYEHRTPVDEFIHTTLLSLFFNYLIVGGMPDAVTAFIETRDIRQVSRIQQEIINLYKRDFTKYESENRKLKIISIYDLIPAELNKQNKKFVFSDLNKELKFDRYENSFLWLKDAGVALPVYNVDEPRIPLLASKNSNIFRLFDSDCGLLTSCYTDYVKLEILRQNGEVNNGALFENAVAQQLAANGFFLYFFKSTKIGEVDFVIEKDGSILYLEVKSGKNTHSHRALNNVLSHDRFHAEAYVLSCDNLEETDDILYLPVYMTYLIQNYQIEDPIINLDLSRLQS